jgi:hypothetical protein
VMSSSAAQADSRNSGGRSFFHEPLGFYSKGFYY